MTTSLEAFLEHHGVKGMKWGVRQDRGHEGEQASARTIKKADKKFDKSLRGVSGFIKVNNAVAEKINPRLDVLNAKPKYQVDMTRPENAKVHKAYISEYRVALQKSLDEVMDEIGTNASGTQRLHLQLEGEGLNTTFTGFTEALQHADQPNVRITPYFNKMGQITGQTVEPNSAQHDEMELDTYLEHFGIKGMRWGVRRDNPSGAAPETSADVKKASAAAAKITKKGGTSALDNSELQALVNRMNLEQQYSTLSSKTQTKSLGVKFLQGTGKFAGNIAREQAKNAANMVLKQQVKKALKAKGLLD